jgi:predicted ferric reductase
VDHSFWYLTRASGFVAYLLLFASVVLGLSMTGSLAGRWYQRFQAYDLHRFLSLFTLGFVAFHMLIVLPDGYFAFQPWELLVPSLSPYRPEYMALGVAAFYVMAIAAGSFYLRHVTGYRVWRFLHYATFLAFVAAFAHGIGAGADSGSDWAQYLYAATGLVAFNLLAYRLLKGGARGLPPRARRQEVAVASQEG